MQHSATLHFPSSHDDSRTKGKSEGVEKTWVGPVRHIATNTAKEGELYIATSNIRTFSGKEILYLQKKVKYLK